VARIIQVSMNCVTDREMLQASREAEISRVGSNDIRYLESHMRGLEMIANIGPLLGLLGTVIGMVAAFSKLETAGTRVDPAMLAGGIWEALLTTVGGLVVAIPAVAAYYIFDSIIERVRGSMKEASLQIMMLENAFQKNERVQHKNESEARMREKEQKLERDRQEQLKREKMLLEQAQRDKQELQKHDKKLHMLEQQQLELQQLIESTPIARQDDQLKFELIENEKRIESEKRIAQEQRLREAESQRAHDAEIQSLREAEEVRLRGEETRMSQIAADMRSTPESTSTLKLLNPRYIQF
jgi:hypothetical protein